MKQRPGSDVVHVVGGGLAGSEAAYFLAEHGVRVVLHEMRPKVKTPAHQTEYFAELVCSNSLKSQAPHSAPAMLKAEMSLLGSLLLRSAGGSSVPAGEALAVDRDLFAQAVTRAIRTHSLITCVEEEVKAPFADGITLFAAGPLTSDALSHWFIKVTGSEDLYFYDAIAPIVEASSIDMSHAFLANRYDRGGQEAYLNCSLDEAHYYQFVDALLAGEMVVPRAFEKEKFFQSCQPIEVIAATGRDSLRFGPMKPVGLEDPQTGKRPFAVVQLRPENRSNTAYNLVGFQTRLKYPEQQRIFRLIPALAHAEFLRLGSIHRNTYLCSPRVMRADLSLKGYPRVYGAGQMTGVEGYLESAASGLLAAVFVLQRIRGLPHSPPPANSALGALLRHVTGSDPERFQPSHIHFGLLDPSLFHLPSGKIGKDAIRQEMSKQAFESFSRWWEGICSCDSESRCRKTES